MKSEARKEKEKKKKIKHRNKIKMYSRAERRGINVAAQLPVSLRCFSTKKKFSFNCNIRLSCFNVSSGRVLLQRGILGGLIRPNVDDLKLGFNHQLSH